MKTRFTSLLLLVLAIAGSGTPRWRAISSAPCCRASRPGARLRAIETHAGGGLVRPGVATVPSTRTALVQIIEDSWQRVVQLVPQLSLELCEDELKGATALLVLATVRRAADDSSVSRATVEQMFREADVNGDGQLSFVEWFEWLGSDPAPSPRDEAALAAAEPAPAPAGSSHSLDDPMVAALSLVLSSAVCTLKTAASISQDPSTLSAAFVAGGMMAGVLDAQVCRAMLSRLSPRTRELVSMALTLESASLPASFRAATSIVTMTAIDRGVESVSQGPSRGAGVGAAAWKATGGGDGSESLGRRVFAALKTGSSAASSVPAANSPAPVDVRAYHWMSTAALAAAATTGMMARGRRRAEGGSGTKKRAQSFEVGGDIVSTVDLSSVPLLVAPPIDDLTTIPVPSAALEVDNAARLADAEAEGPPDDRDDEVEHADVTFLDVEAVEAAGLAEAAAGGVVATSMSIVPLRRAAVAAQTRAPSGLSTVGQAARPAFATVVAASARLEEELRSIKAGLGDLSDAKAYELRQLLLTRGGGSRDVLGLAMALRAARLQQVLAGSGSGAARAARSTLAIQRAPNSALQQLAMETLQLWAPLSFQVGLSAQVPELEVHSYLLLFPRSFGSFVDWYAQFRPMARALLKAFRDSLQRRFQRDSVMPLLSDGIKIQSRIKTPPSAFKKLVKGAKQRQQLHDMLGLRIIISEKKNPARALVADPSVALDDGVDGEDSNVALGAGVGVGGRGAASGGASGGIRGSEEEAAVWRACSIVRSSLTVSASGGSAEWAEDRSRFKDYVTRPKTSGYQSLHMTLVHRESGVRMELQIRSQRMHWEAEHGAAAHSKYKALVLPLPERTSNASEDEISQQ